MIKKILFSLSLLLLIGRLPAFGQRENSNWFFGINAAINFPATGAPAAVAGSAMNTYEATTTVSDAAGQLLFYSNSENIWDRNNQLMPNGTNLGGHQSASQGVISVQSLTNAQQYYVFVVDGAENQLVGGLKYSLVDMTQQGGLGAVTIRRVQVSSVPLTEKLTTVPHANGRDTWVLVHGWQTNVFYAYLFTTSGLQATPVVTSIGSVHSGGGGTYGNANSVGYMRASPNGSKLAVGVRDASFELFDFNPATGQLSNYIPLGPTSRSYGVAFSPDSRLLYGTNLNYTQVYQFDTQAGSATAIANSGVVVANTFDSSGGLQMGPDGKLYVSINNSSYLAVINNPNVRGTGCGFQASAVYLGGKVSQIGLPNFPASQVAPPITATAAFTSTASCVGSAVSFTGTTTPVLSGATATWNFGDPASGSANTATGLTPTHTYTAAGTYQVTLTVTQASLATPAVITQAVTVAPLPRVQLGRDTTLCGSQLLLAAGTQPAGTTYRWQDGSTAATYLARATGIYSVTVTSAAGCASTASRQVTLNAVPTPRLPADTAACGVASVLLRLGAQPAGTTYRWQDGSTAATYLAQASGTYSVQVTTAQGCVGTATSRVQLSAAPTVRLGADTLVCPSAVWTLRPNPQPAGTLYRWQDGSTGATYVARGPGQYSVEVRASATGCPATATLRAGAANCPLLIPNIITPNNDQQNDFFVLKGLTPSEWSLRIFDRWGRPVYDQPRYDNRWSAEGQSEGLYYYILLHNTSGERHQGWVEVVRGS